MLLRDDTTRYFGLHLTRTAGTSLHQLAQALLGAEHCFVVSSYRQMLLDHQQLPQERHLGHRAPIFSFGHYLHESLWGLLLHAGPVEAFTVLREPSSRTRSMVRHLLKEGLDQDTVKEHLAETPNPMCAEILRCVPLARALWPREPMHQQALNALSAFAWVLTVDQVGKFSEHLARSLSDGRSGATIAHLNATEDKEATDIERELLEFDAGEFIREDQLLWTQVRQGALSEANGVHLLDAIQTVYEDQEVAAWTFERHLNRYFCNETILFGGVTETLDQLVQRHQALGRAIDFLKTDTAAAA